MSLSLSNSLATFSAKRLSSKYCLERFPPESHLFPVPARHTLLQADCDPSSATENSVDTASHIYITHRFPPVLTSLVLLLIHTLNLAIQEKNVYFNGIIKTLENGNDM